MNDGFALLVALSKKGLQQIECIGELVREYDSFYWNYCYCLLTAAAAAG